MFTLKEELMTDYCVIQNSIKTVFIFRRNYLTRLIAEGNKVCVLAPNDCSESKELLIQLGVEVINVPSKGFVFSFIVINMWILYFRFFKNKLFICHFISTFTLTFFTLIPFNKKLVVSIEGLGSFFIKHKYLLAILRRIIIRKNIVRFFCNSNERLCLGLSSDFITGGIGVDLNAFDLSLKETFNLIYVGRLIKDKGVFDVIKVFRKLRARGLDLKLTLVGDIYKGNPSSITENDICLLKNEFSDNIIFTGYVTDVAKYYEISDLLLLPSKREGFPVCVMEANSSAVPAIVYDVPGCSDAVLNDINGYKFCSDDIDAMVERIEFLYANVSSLQNLKSSSRKYAIDNFSVSQKTTLFLNEIKRRIK